MTHDSLPSPKAVRWAVTLWGAGDSVKVAPRCPSVAHAYRHHEGMKGDPERPEARASPGRLSPSSRDRPALHPGPKGGAEGAPDVPDKGGFWKGGPAPTCIFHVSRGCSRGAVPGGR